MTGLTAKRLGIDKQSRGSRPRHGCSVIGSLAPMNSLMDGTATDKKHRDTEQEFRTCHHITKANYGGNHERKTTL